MRYSSMTTYRESADAMAPPKFVRSKSAADATTIGSGNTQIHPLPAVAGSTTRRSGIIAVMVGATVHAVATRDVAAASAGSCACGTVVVDVVPFVAARTSCTDDAVAAFKKPPISFTLTRSEAAARMAANGAPTAAAGVVTATE